MPEKMEFSAEISSLMGLIINTFYSNKDIFLREIVSNASDALDKIRFRSLQDRDVLRDDENLKIQITPDLEAKTLTIADTGIGMTKADLINNLGTIARSGTREFMQAVEQGIDQTTLIGQFGVGFYSAFLVADSVVVKSKNVDDTAYEWISSASGTFEINEIDEANAPARGTSITLHLKEDCVDYLEEEKIRDLIKTHSQFVQFPIELFVTREEEVEAEAEEEAEEKEENEDEEPKVESEDDEEKKEEKEAVKETVTRYETLNEQDAIWVRPSEDVTAEEHATFYKNTFGDWQEPLTFKQFKVEGAVTFRGVIYLPKMDQNSIFESKKKQNNVRLYVKRVFITDDAEKLIPEWLSFVRGVVDCDDLPLNISREMLQKNKNIDSIRRGIVKQVFNLLAAVSEDEEKEEDFKTFCKQFGRYLKLGAADEKTTTKQREQISKLLRFDSSKEEFTSLESYVDRMPEVQKNIYYLTGESKAAVESAPCLEILKKKDFEVLYLTEPIDEYAMNQLKEFDGKKLVCASKEDMEIELTEEEQKEFDGKKEKLEMLTQKMKAIYGDKVEKVSISNRLVSSPCVLVSTQFGWSANMERIMKAQAMQSSNEMYGFLMGKKILEINPDHPIISGLADRVENDEADATVPSILELLYETALITAGYTLEKPADFAGRIFSMIASGVSSGASAAVSEEAAVVEEEEDESEEEDLLEEVD